MVDFVSNDFSVINLYKHIDAHFLPDTKHGIEVVVFVLLGNKERVKAVEEGGCELCFWSAPA